MVVGFAVAEEVGSEVIGADVTGETEGAFVGETVGDEVVDITGEAEGAFIGETVGDEVVDITGEAEGAFIGDEVTGFPIGLAVAGFGAHSKTASDVSVSSITLTCSKCLVNLLPTLIGGPSGFPSGRSNSSIALVSHFHRSKSAFGLRLKL